MKLDTPKNGMVGARIPIRDGAVKATGELKYVADMKFPHMLYGKILTSTVPHARIKSIDTSKAEALEGVESVICYKNSPRKYFNSCGETLEIHKMEQLFSDIVRYVGDKVAAVAAVDEKTAEKALRLIEVEYEPLPVNFDLERALDDDAYPIHTVGDLHHGNVLQHIVQSSGDVDTGMAEADFVFEDRFTVPAIHHGAIETHCCIATYDARNKLTVYMPSQDTFAVRVNLSRLFDIPMSRVRVLSPAVGGAFGGKIDMMLEHVAALLAINTRRPVKIVLGRKDDICTMRNRHQMVLYAKTGVKRDGTIVAEDYHVICNAGAYASGSTNIVWAMCGKVFKVHKNRNIRFVGDPVITNTSMGGPMRGFGSPQIMFVQQRQMNRIACALGIDMVELQRKNLVGPDGVDPRFDEPHGNPRPMDCLEEGIKLFGYDQAVKEERESSGRYRIGVGLAVGAHGNGMFGIKPDITAMMMKMNEDGSVIIYTGSHEMGNSGITLQAQMVSEVLGIDMDKIECVSADTDLAPYQMADYSSRGAFVSGYAAVRIAQLLKKEVQKYAAELLKCQPEDVDLHDDLAWNGSECVTLERVAGHAREEHNQEILATHTHASTGLATSYGAHFAKVKVDTETGEVQILDYTAVHDVGRALNPLAVEGQIEGAIQMGAGYALTEGFELDENGRIKNSTFRTYRMLHAHEMPKNINIGFVEKLEPTGPYGAKSIGECSVVPSAPAIVNAISNATGCEFNDLPVKPERILAALSQKREQEK